MTALAWAKASPRRASRSRSSTGCRQSPCQGLSFYDGDKFPAWKGNAFVGAMRNNTGQHIQRVQFNAKGEPTGRELILGELKQRIREVKPGPDGFIYAMTDETFGAVIKIEPGP